MFIRYDVEQDEVVATYKDLEELLYETNYFYHDTYKDEENYEPDLEIKTLEEAYELWEGNAWYIYQDVKTLGGFKNDNN